MAERCNVEDEWSSSRRRRRRRRRKDVPLKTNAQNCCPRFANVLCASFLDDIIDIMLDGDPGEAQDGVREWE